MGQIYLGSVYNSFARLVTARYADGLRAVVGLLTAGASGLARLRSAPVLRLRQFVAGVIDDVLLGASCRSGDLKTDKVFGEHDERDQQQALEQPGDKHAAIREHANGRFSSERLRRAGERGAYGGLELFPGGGPSHQQVRRLGPLGVDFGDGGNFGHCLGLRFGLRYFLGEFVLV